MRKPFSFLMIVVFLLNQKLYAASEEGRKISLISPFSQSLSSQPIASIPLSEPPKAYSASIEDLQRKLLELKIEKEEEKARQEEEMRAQMIRQQSMEFWGGVVKTTGYIVLGICSAIFLGYVGYNAPEFVRWAVQEIARALWGFAKESGEIAGKVVNQAVDAAGNFFNNVLGAGADFFKTQPNIDNSLVRGTASNSKTVQTEDYFSSKSLLLKVLSQGDEDKGPSPRARYKSSSVDVKGLIKKSKEANKNGPENRASQSIEQIALFSFP